MSAAPAEPPLHLDESDVCAKLWKIILYAFFNKKSNHIERSQLALGTVATRHIYLIVEVVKIRNLIVKKPHSTYRFDSGMLERRALKEGKKLWLHP